MCGPLSLLLGDRRPGDVGGECSTNNSLIYLVDSIIMSYHRVYSIRVFPRLAQAPDGSLEGLLRPRQG
jgi:hypothetical protein